MQANDKKRYIKPSGEKESFLLRLGYGIHETFNISKWTVVDQKHINGRIVSLSSSNSLFIFTNNLIKLSLDKIKKGKSVTRRVFNLNNGKLKPYYNYILSMYKNVIFSLSHIGFIMNCIKLK